MEADKQVSTPNLDELLGDPGKNLQGEKLATEAGIRTQVADLMTIEAYGSPEVMEQAIQRKVAAVESDVRHYLTMLEQGQEKGIEDVHVPHIVPDDRYVADLINAAREDPVTIEKFNMQVDNLLEALDGFEEEAEKPEEEPAASLPPLVDPFEKDVDYGLQIYDTAKHAMGTLGERALHLVGAGRHRHGE